MQIKHIKTHCIKVRESIESILDHYINKDNFSENYILVITSKIISVSQGKVVDKNSITKQELIKQQADLILDPVASSASSHYGIYLTIKDGILIPSAGIDESNGDNAYILYPENIQETAARIWQYLRDKLKINNLGVLITDSHTTPMRRGVTGIALGWCGFKPLYSYVNKPDIYGRPLKITQVNILDALATAAVLVMGEGNEQTPMAIINDAPKITFLNRRPNTEEQQSIIISLQEDLYAPLFNNNNWI